VSIPLKYELLHEINAVSVYKVEKEDWHLSLIDYLKHRKLPSNVRQKMKIQRRASRFLC